MIAAGGVEGAKICLGVGPCFVGISFLLPIHHFLFSEDLTEVHLLSVDLNLLGVGRWNAHADALLLAFVEGSFVGGDVRDSVPGLAGNCKRLCFFCAWLFSTTCS